MVNGNKASAGRWVLCWWVLRTFAEKRGVVKFENVRFCSGSAGADANSPRSSGCFCLTSPTSARVRLLQGSSAPLNPRHGFFSLLSLVPAPYVLVSVSLQPCLRVYLCLQAGFGKPGEVSPQSGMAAATLPSPASAVFQH